MKNKIPILLSFFVLLFNPLVISAFNIPKYSGYVNDYAGMLDANARIAIESVAKEVESKTTAEIAVVTINSLEDETLEGASVKVFQKWGIGKKDKDNGVLILVSKNDRKIRIEVGYGLEGAITDGTAGSIIDNYILPYFKTGDFSKGLYYGTIAVSNEIAKEYKVQLSFQQGSRNTENSRRRSTNKFVPLVFFLIFIIIRILMARRGFYPGGYYGGGSSGGFGGGFGGFGGGMSGGGGSSRGW